MAYGDQPTAKVDDIEIPLLGFGTWQLEPDDARRMVAEALRIGYRHIDTAWIYKNEKAVGEGIRDSGVPRQDLFLTTKIWVEHFDREGLLKQARESADSLGTTPDLLLLHWPKPTPSFEETLGALNEAKDQGLTRSIGLSNFPSAQWREAQALSKAKLVTNQVERFDRVTGQPRYKERCKYRPKERTFTVAATLGGALPAWAEQEVIAHVKQGGPSWILERVVVPDLRFREGLSPTPWRSPY